MWLKYLLLSLLAMKIHCMSDEKTFSGGRCVTCIPIDPDNCEGELELYPFENLQQNFT